MMFFLSGLFVWSSITRKDSWKFLSDRIFRIGVPALLAVLLLMTASYYPAYRATAVDPSLAGFWQQWLALGHWPCGPQWFLWQLLAMNVVAVGLHRVAPRWGEWLGRLTASARTQPLRFFAGLALASALAYVPLVLIFGPWDWGSFALFGIQLSRPLHYAVYFFAGVAVGAYGLERGLVALDGMLARLWAMWVVAALVGFGLWGVPTGMALEYGAGKVPLVLQLAAAFGFVLACASGCLALIAVLLRFGRSRSRALDSLSANAYGIYLVHYVFVVWLQYALLNAPLFAVVKTLIVFAGALLASWVLVTSFGRISVGSRVIGARR